MLWHVLKRLAGNCGKQLLLTSISVSLGVNVFLMYLLISLFYSVSLILQGDRAVLTEAAVLLCLLLFDEVARTETWYENPLI